MRSSDWSLSRAAERRRLAIPLDDPDAVDAERVGPKAATLARLRQARDPSPRAPG